MKSILTLTLASCLLTLLSCEPQPLEKQEVKTSEAVAQSYGGLLLFIKSHPKREIAQRYPVIKRDLVQEKIEEIKKMKGLEILTGVANTLNDISFERQVEAMVNLTKEKYPDADGIILERLDEAIPIKLVK